MDNFTDPGSQRAHKQISSILLSWKIILLSCLTIGLAPFTPEPHIWGKLKWVMGGAHGMVMMDWLDLLFHGIPWCLLIYKSMISIIKLKRN